MEFSEYQRQLDHLERERGWDRVLPSHTFMHMTEELGEIARVIERLEGYRETDLEQPDLVRELAGELADLMAFLFKLANQHGIDVDQAMQEHLDKFRSRYESIERGRQDMARYVAHQERNLDWIKGTQNPLPPTKTEGGPSGPSKENT